jgi:2-keto-3-deoxy-6-phosphogluconate aldolase
VGWAGELDREGRVTMEKLAAQAPGRYIALVRAEAVSAAEATVSALQEAGAKVISLPAGADWEESARLLVSEVRGVAG